MTLFKTDYSETHLSLTDKVATAKILTQLQQECHQSPQFPLESTTWSQNCFQFNSQIKADTSVSGLQKHKDFATFSSNRHALCDFASKSIGTKGNSSYLQAVHLNQLGMGDLFRNNVSHIAHAPVSLGEHTLMSQLQKNNMRIRALHQPQMVSSSDLTFNNFRNPLLFSSQFRQQEQQKKTNIIDSGTMSIPLHMLCQLIVSFFIAILGNLRHRS